jgi:hypothetical protein
VTVTSHQRLWPLQGHVTSVKRNRAEQRELPANQAACIWGSGTGASSLPVVGRVRETPGPIHNPRASASSRCCAAAESSAGRQGERPGAGTEEGPREGGQGHAPPDSGRIVAPCLPRLWLAAGRLCRIRDFPLILLRFGIVPVPGGQRCGFDVTLALRRGAAHDARLWRTAV